MENNTTTWQKPDEMLIAEFMGWKIEKVEAYSIEHWAVVSPNGVRISKVLANFWGTHEDTYQTEIKYLCKPNGIFGAYHTLWDKLMPVVEAIEATKQKDGVTHRYVTISDTFCCIDHDTIGVIDASKPTKIEAVYDCVIRFIKWYNEQEASKC